jgi:hypothetical protein
MTLVRSSFIGFASSAVADTISNCVRVVKTVKQASVSNGNILSYTEVIQNIVETDGLYGLFGRGLGSRILCDGLQSLVFILVWNFFRTPTIGRSKSENDVGALDKKFPATSKLGHLVKGGTTSQSAASMYKVQSIGNELLSYSKSKNLKR